MIRQQLTSYGAALLAVLLATVSTQAASNFSFRGNLATDDEVLFFDFAVGSDSNVVLKTLSYAGGTNAAGEFIPAGGFDPILSLFDSVGRLIDSNDDGFPPQVPVDPNTGESYDTYLETSLSAGQYTVAVSQFDNFPVSSQLSDGFERSGEPNFRNGFVDVTDDQRTSAWAFDILNVEAADGPGLDQGPPPPTPEEPSDSGVVPEPTSLAIWTTFLALFSVIIRRRHFEAARG